MSSDVASTSATQTRKIRGDEIAATRRLREAMNDIFNETGVDELERRHACALEALDTLPDNSLRNGEYTLKTSYAVIRPIDPIAPVASQKPSKDLQILNIFNALGRPVSIDDAMKALSEGGLTLKKPSFSTKLARWAQNGWLKRFAPGVYSLTEEGQKERTKRLTYEQ